MAVEANAQIIYSEGPPRPVGVPWSIDYSTGGQPRDQVVPPDTIANLFSNVNATEVINGITDYRMIYLDNNGNAALNSLEMYLGGQLNTPAQLYLGFYLANDVQRYVFTPYPTSGTVTFTYYDAFNNPYVLQPISAGGNPADMAANLQNQLNALEDIVGQSILGGVVCNIVGGLVSDLTLQVSFTGASGNKFQRLMSSTNTMGVTVSPSKFANGTPINTVPDPTDGLTLPSNVTFFLAPAASPIPIGTLLNNPNVSGEGELCPIWIKRVIPEGSSAQDVAGATLQISSLVYPPLPSPTVTPSPTASPTPTVTEGPTASPTMTPSPTPTVTFTPGPTPSPTTTESPTPTPTSTQPTATPTMTPTGTPTATPTPTASGTTTPTPTTTASPTPTPTPTRVPGTLFMWGNQLQGQMDNNVVSGIVSSPIQVATGYLFQEVRSGNNRFTGGITKTNDLYIWGNNQGGVLGNSSTISSAIPVLVPGSGTIKYSTQGYSLALGSTHVLAIRSNNVLTAWGFNAYGELGQNNVRDRSSPVQVGALTNWIKVNAGVSVSMAQNTLGKIWMWGQNTYGQCGVDTKLNISSPTMVSFGGSWAVSNSWQTFATYTHTLAIDSTDNLWGWGRNNLGQLGIGNINNYSLPTFLGTNYKMVSVALNMSAAIKTDNTLWVWGYNSAGELGLGDTIPRSSPCQVAGSWLRVAALNNAGVVIAQKTDGSLWSWGENTGGLLGTNSTTPLYVSSPVQVATNQANWSILFGGTESAGAL